MRRKKLQEPTRPNWREMQPKSFLSRSVRSRLSSHNWDIENQRETESYMGGVQVVDVFQTLFDLVSATLRVGTRQVKKGQSQKVKDVQILRDDAKKMAGKGMIDKNEVASYPLKLFPASPVLNSETSNEKVTFSYIPIFTKWSSVTVFEGNTARKGFYYFP